MFKWIKYLLNEQSDERFRAGFEEHQIATNRSVNLSRSGDIYVDPVIQAAWIEWANLERAEISAW